MLVFTYRPSQSERRLMATLMAMSMQVYVALPSFSATPETTPACEQMADAAAADLAARFDAALKSKHPDHVTRLFTPDAVVKGFGSPVVRVDYASIRDYFLYFLQYEPTLAFEGRRIETGCNFAVDSGTYVWTLKPRDATTSASQAVPQRYRMTMERVGGTWLISELIEEPKGAEAVEAASLFALPAPQPMRAAETIAATVPAVAGYLKRSTDDATVGNTPQISKPAKPASKSSAPADEDKAATYQHWFDFGR